MSVYSAVLSPFAIFISAKAEHFFRIIQESRSPAIEKMKAMVSQDQIAILKYYLKLLAQTKATRSTQSMQNKEKYCLEAAKDIKNVGQKVKDKLHQRLKLQMNAGKNIFFRHIEQSPLFGHISHGDLLRLDKIKK